ncbi:MAG: type II toxin-antitoxin system YafQ family toxin [Candidatus Delongbacteria bacterium]|jgi:mRNA interferase YafQ|nr:type II toxin-antitoxin system YafQ family toxin [Candidatus Delongbacteria bacterium]
MYKANFTNKFKKDYKLCKKRGYDMKAFEDVYDILTKSGSLPAKYKPLNLSGNWVGFIDAHIKPDWILIYNVDGNRINFTRMGTHSDLF